MRPPGSAAACRPADARVEIVGAHDQRPRLQRRPPQRERQLFFAEALIATQLDHSRIVKVIDLDMARDSRPFLVMERVDGTNLRSFVRAAREQGIAHLSLDLVTYIVGEILFALVYAHGRNIGDADAGVVHSDITPGNILLSSSGEVKLTDFGIARFAASAGPMSQAIGTPRYMSSEQLGGAPERATDVYGLGVVLHELLEGERFLAGLSPDQFRARVLRGPPPELRREGVPEWLDDLRRDMIATDPGRRPTAAEARAVLVEHCPRYLAAAVQLEEDYARIVGRARSGMTQLVEAEVELDEVVPAPDDDEIEIPPTELLSAAEVAKSVAAIDAAVTAVEAGDGSESEPEPSAHPLAVESRPEDERPRQPPSAGRWLAIASALAALGLCFWGLSLLVRALREPAPVVAAAQDTPAPTVAPDETPPDLGTRPIDAIEAEPEPEEPAPPPDLPVPAAELEATPETEVVTAPEPEPKPEVEKATKPKPKARPKIGVMFLVETKLEGHVKAGGKLIPIKGRSGYAELPTGSHKVSWRPVGEDSWQLFGRIKIEDIAPSRYKVRLDEGKIAEFGQL